LDLPVVYYCQLLLVARDRSAEKTAPDGQHNEARELEEIAAKQKYNGSENEEGAVRRLFLCRAEALPGSVKIRPKAPFFQSANSRSGAGNRSLPR